MSFLVLPGERESGEIMGGGDWANEYSYKNPTTGEWEYTSSPRIYGDNGNLTYEEWMMEERGWKPGTYGPSASDNAYNEWLKTITPKNTYRMNGMGEIIEGTKPNKAVSGELVTTDEKSPVSTDVITADSGGNSSSTASSEEVIESLSTSEDKGTDYSWLTEATEEAIPENKEDKKEASENKEGEYYTFGITKEPSKKEEDDEYNWVTDDSNENKVAKNNTENKPANKINDIANAIRNIGKNADNTTDFNGEKVSEEEFDIGKKAGKNSLEDYEKDYQDAINKYGKDSKQALKAEAKLSAHLASIEAIAEAAIPNAEPYLSTVNIQPDKRVNKKIGNYTYTIENIGKNEEGNTEFVVVINDNKTQLMYSFKAKGEETSISKESLAEERSKIANMVDKSMIANGLKEAPVSEDPEESAPVENITEKPATVIPKTPVETTPSDELDFSAIPDDSEIIEIDRTTPVGLTPSDELDFSAIPDDSEIIEIDKTTPKDETKEPVRPVKEIKEELSKIDVSTVTNVEEAKGAEEKITTLANEGAKSLHNEFTTIYKNLINKGVKAKDIYDQPEMAEYSQNVFEFGQDLYEGSSRLEDRTDELGLTVDKLNKKYLNKHLDEMSWKVSQLDPENSKSVGSYYSPGSDMNGTSVQPTGVNISKEDIKTLERYANGIQSSKDAGLAMMKAGAFNGAKNVEGGEHTEDWKKSMALEKGNFKEGAKEFIKDQGKLTWKDYFAAAVKGALGTVVTVLGVAVAPANPTLGTLLIVAGTSSAGKAGLQITTDVVRSKSTNEEMMFGSGEGGKDVIRDIYNRSLEPANFGDPKSVGTYTNAGGGAIKIAIGFMELFENPVVGVEAIRSGIVDINNAGKGGLRGTLGNGIDSLYELADAISTLLNRADLSPEALGLTKTLPTFIPNVKDKKIWNGDYTVYNEDENYTAEPAAASEYGSAESSEESSEEEQEALDSTYSGAKEQAKNSNLATDYNAGMEQEVNEAVSDKYVKVFKVMIDKEPDYIRKVLIAIPKNHCESVWK